MHEFDKGRSVPAEELNASCVQSGQEGYDLLFEFGADGLAPVGLGRKRRTKAEALVPWRVQDLMVAVCFDGPRGGGGSRAEGGPLPATLAYERLTGGGGGGRPRSRFLLMRIVVGPSAPGGTGVSILVGGGGSNGAGVGIGAGAGGLATRPESVTPKGLTWYSLPPLSTKASKPKARAKGSITRESALIAVSGRRPARTPSIAVRKSAQASMRWVYWSGASGKSPEWAEPALDECCVGGGSSPLVSMARKGEEEETDHGCREIVLEDDGPCSKRRRWWYQIKMRWVTWVTPSSSFKAGKQRRRSSVRYLD
ncbi:hypothetical protein F5887DRAFT_1220143 [Amanita rubescens]|nr:hypothetical protein F5887DRAFT_1220143 [Amanita rubescens]